MEDQGDTRVVTAASRASTRQYHVPLASVTDLLVPVCQLEVYLIVEKDELLLTCTRYCTDPPLGFVDGFHARPIEQPEYEEQDPSGSAITTGAVGGAVEEALDNMKVSDADQDETSEVFTESRDWTRQYQVPLPRVGDQLVPVIHPDE